MTCVAYLRTRRLVSNVNKTIWTPQWKCCWLRILDILYELYCWLRIFQTTHAMSCESMAAVQDAAMRLPTTVTSAGDLAQYRFSCCAQCTICSSLKVIYCVVTLAWLHCRYTGRERLFGVQTLWTQDSLDPRHFGSSNLCVFTEEYLNANFLSVF